MASAMIMRDYVSKQYGGRWPEKVARMPDAQVASIYHKMIDKEEKLKEPVQDIWGGKQLSMFDYEKEDDIL